jgi:hypothetical protein
MAARYFSSGMDSKLVSVFLMTFNLLPPGLVSCMLVAGHKKWEYIIEGCALCERRGRIPGPESKGLK